MRVQTSKINTILVQYTEALLIGSFILVNAYPVPALSFANEIQGEAQFTQSNFIEVTATAYTSSSNETDYSPFVTASGSKTRYGVIAANFLPLHTKVRIGNRIFRVEDRMNERYNNMPIIDIWMPSLEQAEQFGTRKILIEVQD